MMHPVVLDVDTGIDDALAILFAVKHPGIDLRAVTCVSGNVEVDQVAANTLAILELAGADHVPVAKGAILPLVEPRVDASWVHGAAGLGNLELPPPSSLPDPRTALELLRDTILGSDSPVTLIALAPLTNIALFIRAYPTLARRLDRIVFMGGSASSGNATAVAEFNIWHDPEAAYIVINSGIPLVMYGLDVFETIEVPHEQILELRLSQDEVVRAAGLLLGHEIRHPETGMRFVMRVIGDAGAVCAVAYPELFTFETWPIQVALGAGIGRGQTVVDRRRNAVGREIHPWPTAQVALETQSHVVVERFISTLRTDAR